MSSSQFEIIYKDHFHALHSFAFKLTKNKMDADDLVQETAIKVFRNFSSYREADSFRNWSFTILRNTFITNFKKRKRMNIVSVPLEDLNIECQSSVYVDANIYSEKHLKILRAYIENLGDTSKEPLKMFLNGYTYKEISIYLKIPIGTVKSRINFARKKLKLSYQTTSKPIINLHKVA